MDESGTFCGVGNFPMLIPYSEVCKMVQAAQKIEAIEARMATLEEQNAALRSMYFELLEKFGELRRML